VKKDGRREPYNSDKLRRGIQVACKKRPISMAQIDNIVARISKWVQSANDRELDAKSIGQVVVEELRRLDDVAYVRFASVYRNFRDLNEFVETLSSSHKTPRS